MPTYPLHSRLKNAYLALRGKDIPKRPRREIPPITWEEIAEIKEFFPMEKFFIFGHARSGTTVLARLIRLHPEVHCNYQAHFFTRQPLLEALVADQAVGEWLCRKSNRWNHEGDLSALVLRACADFIMEREARRVGARIVGDKSPNTLLNGESVRLMHKVYPDARLVFIIRDGRDTLISHRFQAFIDFPHHLSKADLKIRQAFMDDPTSFFQKEQSVFTEKSLLQAAENWVRNVQETHQMGLDYYQDRYQAIRYEDLIVSTWETMQHLWQWMGATTIPLELATSVKQEMEQNPDEQWQLEKAGKIANSLPKGKPGAWRQFFTHTDLQLFYQVAGEVLRSWGYPLD